MPGGAGRSAISRVRELARWKRWARGDCIRVALGPSIGLCCFEVDAVLAETFVHKTPMQADHIRTGRTGKAYLDLRVSSPAISELRYRRVTHYSNWAVHQMCKRTLLFPPRGWRRDHGIADELHWV
jgi:copper oxidase (laccase) domain-containing protein